MINYVCIGGRLADNPMASKTESGITMTFIRVVVDRDEVSPVTGKRKADIITVEVFGKMADLVAYNYRKDDGVVISGHLRSIYYSREDGTHTITMVVAADKVSGKPGTFEEIEE